MLQYQKKECLRLKIKTEGKVDIIVGMMMFLILLIAILFAFRISQYMVTAAGVEDALAASNLASAVVDLEEYGKSNTIHIPDAEAAFGIFREALCYNLELDQYMNTSNKNFLTAPVEIKEYRIFNVVGEKVHILVLDGNGCLCKEECGSIGEVYTPDNILVETTTIYSRIGFWVEGLMGQQIYAEKEKSIDIKRCDSE